jgi:hypothetical protein
MVKKNQLGFTLIEVLVGIFLILIVFLGIFGAYQLGFRVVGLSERKITATQIAQGEIEKIRNLPYLEIGTIGANLPYASGTLESVTTTILNGVEYRIERKIKYIYDQTDSDEECPLDYKRAEIKVSFSGVLSGEVLLTTDISPKNLVEEERACLNQPAGILSVKVFDAQGNFVPSPLIQVFDPQSGQLRDEVTPSEGKYGFPLDPGPWQIRVSKNGYSSERTYSIEEVPIPEKPNPIVLGGQIVEISFLIDKISSMIVKTLTTFSQDYFFDSFDNENKISQKEHVSIFNSQASLATTSEGYYLSGYLFSIEISPSNLIKWNQFLFNDFEEEGTDLKYQIYYASGTDWFLIPDADLPGNSVGFDSSPVNLKNLSTSTYSRLKLKANFSSNSNSLTPILYDWQLIWQTTQSLPIPNVVFNLRGEKLIGRDANENPIYKFSTTSQTGQTGQVEISNLEWDIYHFSNFQKDSQSLDLATSSPPHPISLAPSTSLDVFLYLEAQNSLLVLVQDLDTLNPIFAATTTLSTNGFSQTQYTDISGQTIFIPLISQNYNLSVKAEGYYPTSTTIFVSGKTTKLIKLIPKD